jgi:hypothetical protein
MSRKLSLQARHIADESRVRNLAAQAEARGPREPALIRRYPLPRETFARIWEAWRDG